MTVTITKAGVLPETTILAAKCGRCKCEFTFNPPDARLQGDQRDGDYYLLPCPTCRHDVYRSVKP